MKLKLVISILAVLTFLSFSCKSGSSIEPYTYTTGYLSIDYDSIEPVYEIDFGSDDELVITLSGTFTGQNMFLVKMNTNDSVVDSESAGYVKSDNVSRSLMFADTKKVPELESTIPVKWDHIASMEFLNLYKPKEDSSVFVPSRSVVPEKRELIGYGTTGTPAINSTKLFWVENAPGSFIQIEAVLKSIGEYAYVWVSNNSVDGFSDHDYDNFSDDSTESTDNKLTQDQINILADKFNGTGDFDDGIYELVTNVCGYEYGGGPEGTGGKDEDKHVSILIYDIDYNDYGISQTGGLFGYFWGKDYFNDPVYESNLSEIFYIDSYFLDKYSDEMYSTLAHEFQHMIHFNRKWVEDNKRLVSETWYNEMLSMLVEDILQVDKLFLDDSASPKFRTNQFVDGYYLSGVTDWLGGDDVLYSYASSFMFGAFLTRNFGGAELIQEMLDSDSVDQASVTDALVAIGYNSESFNSVFNKYHTALIYSAANVPAGNLVVDKDKSATVGTSDYYQRAFDIYGYNNSYSYQGPLLFYADSKLALRPRGMSIHIDDPWLGLTGTQTLNLNVVAPSPGVKYYLTFR